MRRRAILRGILAAFALSTGLARTALAVANPRYPIYIGPVGRIERLYLTEGEIVDRLLPYWLADGFGLAEELPAVVHEHCAASHAWRQMPSGHFYAAEEQPDGWISYHPDDYVIHHGRLR